MSDTSRFLSRADGPTSRPRSRHAPADPTIAPHTAAEVRATRAWAEHFRSLGFNPIPSRADEKRPLLRWSEWADRQVPRSLFERFETANMQLLCGRRWGLVIIDLDGTEAVEHWARNYPPLPRTWVTRSGGEGQHVWFTVPTEGGPIPSGRLWGEWDPAGGKLGRGDWVGRRNIEFIGDRKLVVAPPSIHPTTGRRYRFLAGHSPKSIHRPARAPSWVLNLPRLAAPRPERQPEPIPPRPRTTFVPAGGDRYDRAEVLAAIGDKVALASSWGLRLAGRSPNRDGWIPCHAIDRDDRRPSASFHVGGWYWEASRGPRSIGMFDLAVELGIYRDWRDAVADLGGRYHARQLP